MKQRFTLFSVLLLSAFATLGAQEETYYDLTDIYVKNARFEKHVDYPVTATGNLSNTNAYIDNWEVYNTTPLASAVFAYGTAATFDGTTLPATSPDGTVGSGLAMLPSHAESSSQPGKIQFSQDLKLPKGSYKFVAIWYNTATEESCESQLTWVQSTVKRSAVKAFPAQTWTRDSVVTNITVPSKQTGRQGKLTIGYLVRQTAGNEIAHLVLDRVMVLRTTPVDEADIVIKKEDLLAAITTAQEFYEQNNIATLKEKIDEAQEVYDDTSATMEEVMSSLRALEGVNENADWEYVKSAKLRYLRGATKCLVRLKAGGFEDGTYTSTVYLSSSADPNAEGISPNRTIAHNGTIYVFENLTPCTRYYLHGYVKTNEGRIKQAVSQKFYTIPMGQVSCSYNNGGSGDENTRINNAITSACYYFNNMTSTIRNFNMGYSAGTPTADCNYTSTPWINMGANSSYQRTGTIMHEMVHGLGVITYSTQWAGDVLRSESGTGKWLGDRATEAVIFWENDENEYLRGDKQHMWPYGINGASEDNGTEALYLANATITQALGEDGLEHNIWVRHADPYYAFDQEDDVKYYLKNESETYGLYTSFLTETAEGKVQWKEMSNEEATDDDHNAWYVTFTPNNQQYQFRNAATGKYLTLSGTSMSLSSTTNPGSNQDFHLMKARVDAIDGTDFRAYWMVHTSSWTPNTMTAGSNGAVSGSSLDRRNDAKQQRWLILNSEQINTIDRIAAKAFKADLNKIITHMENLVATPHTEETEGVDEAINTQIGQLKAAVQTAASTKDVQDLIKQAQLAEYNFLCGATPIYMAMPFDVSLLITNPDFDTTGGWSTAPSLEFGCAEFFQQTFTMYQTLTDMPAGTYLVKVQGFQRPGTTAASYEAYTNSTDNITTYLVAGSTSQKLKNIAADAQPAKFDIGNEASAGTPAVYMPNNREAANTYFNAGLYWNEAYGTVANDGATFRIGLRCSSSNEYYWTCFDNFRLYYYGSLTKEQITSIQNLTPNAASAEEGVVYDLQGRKVLDEGRKMKDLKPGIYIVNGKKVVIK